MKQRAEEFVNSKVSELNGLAPDKLTVIKWLTDFASDEVKAINYNRCSLQLKANKEAKTLELENELKELTEDLEFEIDIPKVHKIGMLILKEKIQLLKSL